MTAAATARNSGWRDNSRHTYLLIFPPELQAEAVIAWLVALSGVLRSGFWRLLGLPAIVFELVATDRGLAHRLHVPRQYADYIVAQLRTLVPGIRVTREERPARQPWTRAVELGQTRTSRSLRILSPEAMAASLLASVQVGEGEQVLVQWLVSPAVPERSPAQERSERSDLFGLPLLFPAAQPGKDEVTDQRQKLSDAPNYLALLRIGAVSSTPSRADHLLHRVRQALGSIRSADNGLHGRWWLASSVVGERINERKAPLVSFPIKLSVTELASLIAWPLGRPHVAGLPPGRARHLPATEAVPRVGRILGDANFPGAERPVALSPIDACKHVVATGPTGTGKTTMLSHWIISDMRASHPVVLIEAKGDLYDLALGGVPLERKNDVIILEVGDGQYPVGFNVLQGNAEVVAADLQRLFEHLYPQDARGVRVRQGLYHAILTLMLSRNARAPMTFADIGPLCVPRADQVAFSDNLIRGVAHIEELAVFWQELENLSREQRAMYFGPIMARVWQLNARRDIRNIIGQSNSGFDMRQVIKDRKILLVNLAGLGDDVASLVGSLLLNSLWSAIKGGAAHGHGKVGESMREYVV